MRDFLDTFANHSNENIANILETEDETTPTTDTLSNMMLGKFYEKRGIEFAPCVTI